MRKMRDLFKKTGVTKGTFHTKIGTIKDKNSKELKKQKNLRRGGKNTQTDILEHEVKCSLGSITIDKASRSDGITAESFQFLKDDAVKVLHSICHQIWKTQQWPQDWKRSTFIPISKKGNAKECSTSTQLHSFHIRAK